MFHSDLQEGYARFVLRVVTIAMFFITPFIGDKCCQLRNQLKLLRNQNVTVTSMTGWIKGPSSLITAFRIRRLPAGFFGLMMIVIAGSALVTDLLVAKFVNAVYYQTRCTLDAGMVSDGRNGVSRFPPYHSQGYFVASTAQTNSVYNGGLYGIYTKSNSYNNFAAEIQDTMGNWNCSKDGAPQIYNSSAFYDYEVVSDLVSQNLIYDRTNSYVNTSNTDPTTGRSQYASRQLVIMSASSSNSTSDLSFKIAVDLEDVQDPVSKFYVQKTMQSYYCELQSWDGYENMTSTILSGIDPDYIVSSWSVPLQGNLYESLSDTTATEGVDDWMRYMLNSMTMIAGAQSLSNSTGLQDMDYGCIVLHTEIPNYVVGFVILSGLFPIVLSTIAIVLSIMVFRASRKYDQENKGNQLSSKELKESVPNGLVGWMVHAAQETNRTSERPDEHGLTNWRLTSKNFNNQRLVMVRTNDNGESEHMLQKPNVGMPNNGYNNWNGSQNSSFFNQKSGYTSVNPRDTHH